MPTQVPPGVAPETPRSVRPPANGYLPTWAYRRGDGGLQPPWFFVGCHGGAGCTTLAHAIPTLTDSPAGDGRYWPLPEPGGRADVVLVARSHATGLRAAQGAARQWADGALPPEVHLLGLAVVADAPGRRPKPLRDLLHLISGGLPRVWELPWVEALRLGDAADQVPLPSPYSALAADLQQIVYGASHA